MLFTLVLVFGGQLDPASSAGGRSDRLDDLMSWIGRPGLVVAALLAAYVVGTLLVAAVRWPIRYSNRVAIYRAYFIQPYRPDSIEDWAYSPANWRVPVEALADARDAVQSRFNKWPTLFPFSRGSVAEVLVEYERWCDSHGARGDHVPEGLPVVRVLEETMNDGGRRLRLVSADLYSDHDRPQAEAELRDAIVLTLPFAVVAALFNTSLSLATELVLVAVLSILEAMLFIQARRLDRDANSLLLGAVADHTISVPSLDALDWAASGR